MPREQPRLLGLSSNDERNRLVAQSTMKFVVVSTDVDKLSQPPKNKREYLADALMESHEAAAYVVSVGR